MQSVELMMSHTSSYPFDPIFPVFTLSVSCFHCLLTPVAHLFIDLPHFCLPGGVQFHILFDHLEDKLQIIFTYEQLT